MAATHVHVAPQNHTSSRASAAIFHLRSLANASLLFYGPANTSVACGVDRCAYDALMLTNNMFALLPPDAGCLRQRRLLVVNRFYSHVLEGHHANGTHAVHFSSLAAILCTHKETCYRLMTSLAATRVAFAILPQPAVHGVANTLQYVLKGLRGLSLRRLHVTGVTFYDDGQQYLPGYSLVKEGWRHDHHSNKAYAITELTRMAQAFHVSIDYPSCSNSAELLELPPTNASAPSASLLSVAATAAREQSRTSRGSGGWANAAMHENATTRTSDHR